MNIELRNATFSYVAKHGAKRTILDGLTLSIQAGECVGIIGPEGAGKTTLLQLMVGLLQPEAGSVSLQHVDLWRQKREGVELKKRIGFAFQFPEQQFFCENVEEELLSAGKYAGRAGVSPEVALSMFKLSPEFYLNRSPFSLSMGEARRVALALLFMSRPEALLLDEPSVGLDGAGVDLVIDILQKEKAKGTTIVIVSHDIDMLSEVASRIVIISAGQVRADGPVESIFTDEQLLSQHGYELPEVVRCMRGQPGVAPGFYRFDEARAALASIRNM